MQTPHRKDPVSPAHVWNQDTSCCKATAQTTEKLCGISGTETK